MQVALRERNLDLVFGEDAKNRVIEIALQDQGRAEPVRGPDAQLEIQAAITKSNEDHVGRGIRQNVVPRSRHLE